MIIAAAQCLSGIWILYRYRQNYFRAIVLFTCFYMVFLTAAEEMDVTFTLYILFTFFSLAMAEKKLSKGTLLFLIFLLVYGFIGVLFQEPMNTASVLCTRYGFLVLGLMQCSLHLPQSFDVRKEIVFSLRCGTATELFISAYLMVHGDLESRLTINHQAVGGSMSIGLILLILAVYFYDREQWKKHPLWIYLAVNLWVVVMSGTRGYIVMAFLPLIPFAWNYFMERKYYRMRWAAGAVILWICAALLIFRFEDVYETLSDLLRLNESIGYRVYENAFVRELYVIEPWYHKLVGFGLGGRANHLPETLSVAWEAAGGRVWMAEKLLTETTCHNYWYTVLFKQGALGLAAVCTVIIHFVSESFKTRKYSGGMFWTQLFFGAGILISLTYRISSTCGIFETLVLLWTARIFQEKQVR